MMMELLSLIKAYTVAVSICLFCCCEIFIFVLVFLSNIFFSQFNVDRANAEEFYEVYKGVVTEYPVSKRTITYVISLLLFIKVQRLSGLLYGQRKMKEIDHVQ